MSKTNTNPKAAPDLRAKVRGEDRPRLPLLAERPGDAHVQNALGYTLVDHGKNLPEARGLITAALAQSPDNAATLDTMGLLLYREGKYTEALDYLKRANESGADPEIDLHIGEVQWAMGDQAGARKTWAAALEAAPDNEKLRKRIVAARERLAGVQVGDAALERAAQLCMGLGTDGLRGELTVIRAARALAALDGTPAVGDSQIRRVAKPALRHRLRRDPLDETDASARVDRAVQEVLGT